MKAIILAGGRGLRLRPSIKDLPKPMAPIGGRPFLEYLILLLAKSQIKEIILATGYKGDVIKSFFGNGSKWEVKIDYSQETGPLGTAGALKKAAGLFDDRQFLAMNGDSFIDINFGQLASFHNAKKAMATMGLVNVKESSRYGTVKINTDGEITGFSEKNESGQGFINAGVYMLQRDIIEEIPERRTSLEKEVFPNLIEKGLYGVIAEGFFVDIGSPEDYSRLYNNPDKIFLALGIEL